MAPFRARLESVSDVIFLKFLRGSDFELCANNVKRFTFHLITVRPENRYNDCKCPILECAQASARARRCGRADKPFAVLKPFFTNKKSEYIKTMIAIHFHCEHSQ